jgi:threonine/homoserine/homoserine lactone efflux protein
MVSGGQLIGFTLTSLVLIVIPGPGVLFVVGRALAHGRRSALATACGHAAGAGQEVGAGVSGRGPGSRRGGWPPRHRGRAGGG